MSQPLSDGQSCPEESGWTAYLEDFSDNNIKHLGLCSEGAFDISSNRYSNLASDAASCAAARNKITSTTHASSCPYSFGGHPKNIPEKLRLKKTRTKEIISAEVDDSLEDTASSPVNSPKVNSIENKSRNIDVHQMEELGNKSFTSEHCSVVQTDDDDKNKINLNIGKKIDCTDLKKRGLFLVPLSMLVNYFS